MGIQVRKPKPDEFSAVHKMMSYIPEMERPPLKTFMAMVQAGKYPEILVALDGRKPVGMTIYSTRLDWLGHGDTFMYCLAVEPEYRRKGIGRALVEGMKSDIKKYCSDLIGFVVFKENTDAFQFYEDLGAVERIALEDRKYQFMALRARQFNYMRIAQDKSEIVSLLKQHGWQYSVDTDGGLVIPVQTDDEIDTLEKDLSVNSNVIEYWLPMEMPGEVIIP